MVTISSETAAIPALQQILVATDFGSSSLRAVHVAAELAVRLHARLTVLHVLVEPLPLAAETSPPEGPPEDLGDHERNARRELDGFLELLSERALLCEGVIRVGDPSREIVAYAQESACDIIVVGTHGRGALSRWFLGSVAERVVRTSQIAVLTVRALTAPSSPPPPR